ncbi:FkbM family methyltransferase [Polynucleobacter sp. AP-Capit-er-40B-B4]|uniref:FkbM family methyltransferase n=1 Tax=Polynucleobacter sp. AP-Capit-er-40B-B4 TaxID=2576927 RepID=UPI001C0B2868|nr:FkbM family methyltransferase [Polynucleobacter sp. AP-Capit-er-40B-B4]MBU3580980.1 FkbM family methyltransferase [Polynucleobacter sp. AP-Capit-er-40B-B4]
MGFNAAVVEKKLDWSSSAIKFCDDFLQSSLPKYILGCNIYAKSVAEHIDIDGFIDDYSSNLKFLGKPVVKSSLVPQNSLVLNVAGGRPLSARTRLNALGLQNLDYFAFSKIAPLPLRELRFNEGFEREFLENNNKYQWIYNLLKDEESRDVFARLVKFRFDHDISHLEGFTQREDIQYFENFLCLNEDHELFLDVGGYDGYTTQEFIKLCPQFDSIHIFEPDKKNYDSCLAALSQYKNVNFHLLGLSNQKQTLRFNMMGSSSSVSQDGSVIINVDRLDDILKVRPTFIKIDIEGAELAAIEGGRNTILNGHPKMAISIYHNPGDFWRIPELILSIRDDYDVYIRHYTESIYETVMFFLPRKVST